MLTTEPPQVIAQSIASILQTLQRSNFLALEPEVQRLSLDECANLLRSKHLELSQKRQLLEFLKALQGVDGAIDSAIEEIFEDLNTLPF